MKNNYLEEQKKYAEVKLQLGVFPLRKNENIKYEIIELNYDNETAKVSNMNGFVQEKTFHWCRKYLYLP